MSYTNTQAISGLGGLFYVNTGTSGTPVWTVVGEAKGLSLSGRQNSLQDATNLQSVQKEFVATIPDPGAYEINGNYLATDTGQAFLETEFLAARAFGCKIQLPLAVGQTTIGATKTFQGIVKEHNWPDKVDPQALISYKTVIQVTGAVTTTAGS